MVLGLEATSLGQHPYGPKRNKHPHREQPLSLQVVQIPKRMGKRMQIKQGGSSSSGSTVVGAEGAGVVVLLPSQIMPRKKPTREQ